MSDYKIYNQNNMQLLAAMADGSLHAVVADCPYGFGKEPDAAETLKAWLDTGYHEITGSGFMGKKWDAFVPQPLFWKEVLRVLKPGGYVLAFFGTRTYDWGTLAIRLAGFEIRDCIQWIYGSGFPKSHDVSKAIDRQAGAEREVTGTRNDGMRPRSGGSMNFNGRDVVNGVEMSNEINVTAPATPEAQQWQGYGSALKPACELICVARKPLEGTVADNVLKHGCGAINLDGCRIEPSEGDDPRLGGKGTWSSSKMAKNVYEGGYKGVDVGSSPLGRFPANVIFDEEAAKVLDEQSGVSKSIKSSRGVGYTDSEIYGAGNASFDTVRGHADSGGASRFFYCAKASKADRNYGYLNNHPTVKPIKLMRYLVRLVKTPVEGFAIADFFMGSGTTGVACMMEDIDFIGCDEDESSYKIAEARIAHAKAEYKPETQVVSPQIKLF